MAVAVQDEAYRFGRRYLNVLRRIGARGGRNFRFGFRGSYALIGYKGRRKYWIRETSRKRKKGPSSLVARIPIGMYIFIVSSRAFRVVFCYRCLYLSFFVSFASLKKQEKTTERARKDVVKKIFDCESFSLHI